MSKTQPDDKVRAIWLQRFAKYWSGLHCRDNVIVPQANCDSLWHFQHNDGTMESFPSGAILLKKWFHYRTFLWILLNTGDIPEVFTDNVRVTTLVHISFKVNIFSQNQNEKYSKGLYRNVFSMSIKRLYDVAHVV